MYSIQLLFIQEQPKLVMSPQSQFITDNWIKVTQNCAFYHLILLNFIFYYVRTKTEVAKI